MCRKFTTFLILILPFLSQAQKEIEVIYEPATSFVRLIPDSRVLKAGNTYRLIFRNVNPVYIQDQTTIKSFRYISPTPEILKSVLTGVPNSNVFSYFNTKSAGQREFFLKALRYFNDLEILRSESDDLYLKTRLQPDPVLATEKLERLQNIFETSDLQKMVSLLIFYQDYILAAESVYKTNIKKITLKTPDADIVLQEHSRIARIADKIRGINYVRLLDFILRSTDTDDHILSQTFNAGKDLTEVDLLFYDNYIDKTLYSGKLTFHTEQNWSFDLTSGFFFTNLYDKDYYLKESNGGQNRIIEEKKFRGDISVGALAHYSYKVQPDLRIGPAIGASISPFDGRIRYLGGISAFVGSEKLLGISAGVSIGQSEVLSGGVSGDPKAPYLPSGENKIPTYTRIKPGFFLGITYNLTRFKSP